MILDYDKILTLLEGTPLESISYTEIDKVFVGEYPIVSHSSSQVGRILDRVLSDPQNELQAILAEKHFCILDAMQMKIFSLPKEKRKENMYKVDELKEIEVFIRELLSKNFELQAINQMYRDSQLLIAKYETEIRSVKTKNKRLENDIKEVLNDFKRQ